MSEDKETDIKKIQKLSNHPDIIKLMKKIIK